MEQLRVRSETAPISNPELTELRLLTEFENLLAYMDEYGNVPDSVLETVRINRETGLSEISTPYRNTTTYHEVTYRENPETGGRERVIMYLGKTVVEMAMSGMDWYSSAEGRLRGGVELREAAHIQRSLRAGYAQSFISPRATRQDASVAVAKADRVHDEDSLRVSKAIVNDKQEVTRCKMQSILVRDIPFEAWIRMFKDPGSIFGKSFPIGDEHSALSVMELFDQLELPEDKLPEGPVSLVAAVLPYIQDLQARRSVEYQLTRLRADQELYERETVAASREWAEFDLELVRSHKFGRATPAVRTFILQKQHLWNDEALDVLMRHDLGNTKYAMTRELAAVLTRAKQKLISDQVSVVTRNDLATKNVSSEAQQAILRAHQAVSDARSRGASIERIHMLEGRRDRLILREDIQSSGGCSGGTDNAFGTDQEIDPNGVGELVSPFKAESGKDSWSWKQGVCKVKICPSPKPTEVGPCSVCRRCQREFDAGRDPTRAGVAWVGKKAGAVALKSELFRRRSVPKPSRAGRPERSKQLVGSR